jgi:hypothetical protein
LVTGGIELRRVESAISALTASGESPPPRCGRTATRRFVERDRRFKHPWIVEADGADFFGEGFDQEKFAVLNQVDNPLR